MSLQKGGSVDTDWSYDSWKRQITEHMGIRPDEDNTYDYEAYFNKYPEEAWKMLKGDPTAHFSDEFKTVYHPTFSSKSIGNDGSLYSGVRNPKTNPQGLVGGTWSPDYHTFTMSPDGYRGPVGMDDRKWYLENAEDNGVQLREADGSLPIYDGIPWGGVLPNVTIHGSKRSLGGPLVEAAMNEYKNANKWKHGLGGNLFDGTSEDTQQMQIGIPFWQQQAHQPSFFSLDFPVNGGSLPEVVITGQDRRKERLARMQEALEQRTKDYLTESNDNAWIDYSYTRKKPKNPHLAQRAVEGAKAHAAWEKEHPVLNTLGMGLGAAPFAVAAIPAVGAAVESVPAVASALAPGSAFWMNPITQQIVAGTAAAKGFDLAANLGAGYNSWGEGVSDVVNQTTGWNPQDSWYGQLLTDATNPGWYLNPARIMNPIGRVGQATEDAVKGVADNYFFLEHPNSFTRGIGGEAGLQDLIESGLVRGNPVGTEMSARGFAKAYRRNRDNFRDIMDATGRDGIAQRYYNRTLTQEDFDAIKNAAEPYVEAWRTSPKPKNDRFQIALSRANPDPLSDYTDWSAYQAQLASDRLTLKNATSLDDSGQPLAYFYDDGRNPLTAGHDYAASKYGVRINNASDYNPRIFPGHLHYSMPEAVPLTDPNVEVFKKGIFGITRKMDKSKLLQNTNSRIDNSVLDFGNIEDGTFNFTGYKESPYQMHLKRARAKGYDVSNIKVIDLTKDSPERTEYINNSGLVGSFEEKLQMLIGRINKGGGAGNPKGTRYILHTNPDNLDARLSHELNHLLHIPDEPVPKGTVYGGWMNIFGDYFKRFNNTDIAARLSQIRDYYGQTGKEPLTEAMLKYAREHYENDTGLKNRVQEMLWNTGDLKGLAEWGNKHATGLLPFGFIGPYYLNNE